MNWIVVVIIIVIAVVSAIAQTIKNQQEKEQIPRRRSNTNRSNTGAVKTGSSDMDRFLQEIEKLRKRAAEGGDDPNPKKANAKTAKANRAVPVVAPAKRSKRIDVPTIQPSRRIEQLPTATVVPPPPPPPESFPVDQGATIAQSAPQPTDRPTVSKAPVPVQTTAFGKNLVGMLSNKQALPMAIVLQEILGPPKCKTQQSNRG